MMKVMTAERNLKGDHNGTLTNSEGDSEQTHQGDLEHTCLLK